MTNTPFILFATTDMNHQIYTDTVAEKYDINIVHSLKEMENSICNNRIDLIVLDIDLIENQRDEWLIRWVTTRRMIPLILSVNSNEDAVRAINMKAVDFISKPIVPELLMHQINRINKNIMESKINTKINVTINDQLKEKEKELAELQATVIGGILGQVFEIKDIDANSHDIRTQSYVKTLIRKMIEVQNPYQREISLWDISEHIVAAQLHDIGKLFIPTNILMKPGPLTNEEYEIVKDHVNMGVNIIDKIIEKIGNNSYLMITRKYIESHHERWDGNGYPNGLSETRIPLEGRILAIADAYDVITTKRPYKEVKSHDDAVRIINKDCGTQFDPELVKIFNAASTEFKKVNETYK